MKRRIWRFVHNVVAHPLMEILPDRLGTWLHDETGKRGGRLLADVTSPHDELSFVFGDASPPEFTVGAGEHRVECLGVGKLWLSANLARLKARLHMTGLAYR